MQDASAKRDAEHDSSAGRAVAAAALARGEPYTAEHRVCGWRVRTRHAPIIKNSELVVADYSQGAWRRELSLTLIAGQHLPALLAGGNSLELVHEASGVRISFCALEGLREWALLDLPPVPHLSPHAPSAAWEYTFTTTYPGATTMLPPRAPAAMHLPPQPDQTSFYSRPAVDLASGTAKLRRPLCKCKGVNGRAALVTLAAPAKQAKPPKSPWPPHVTLREVPLSSPQPTAAEEPPPPPPPPAWRPTDEPLALEVRLRRASSPAFTDAVELWRDDQDPQSLSWLRCRVLCARDFWVASVRCFVRVNGVRARLLDTRYVGDGHRVLRERSWREGSWEALVGRSGASHVDLGGQDDQVASMRLPLLRPPVVEVLTLPSVKAEELTAAGTARHLVDEVASLACLSVAWQRVTRADVLCVGRTCVVAFSDGGGEDGGEGGSGCCDQGEGVGAVAGGPAALEMLDASTGRVHWSRPSSLLTAPLTRLNTAALAPTDEDGGRLALGGCNGCVLVWRAATAQMLCAFRVAPAAAAAATVLCAVDHWVEHLVWGADGCWLGAAAGRYLRLQPVQGGVQGGGLAGSMHAGMQGGGLAGSMPAGGAADFDDCPAGGAADFDDCPAGGDMLRPSVAVAPKAVAALSMTSSALAYATYGGVGMLRCSGGVRGDSGSIGGDVGDDDVGDDDGGGDCSTRDVEDCTAATASTPAAPLASLPAHCPQPNMALPVRPNVGMAPTHISLPIGAAAVLCVATSPDGTCLAAGCLDMRVRCFPLPTSKVAQASSTRAVSVAPTRGAGASPHSTAVDWVGFNGAVTLVGWSSAGRWLAALGGVSLLVMPQGKPTAGAGPTAGATSSEALAWAQAARTATGPPDAAGRPAIPIVCVGARHATFAWAAAHIGARDGVRRESLLCTLEARTCRVLLFDLERVDGGVPQRAWPVVAVAMPHGVSGALSALAPLTAAFAYRARTAEPAAGGVVEDEDGLVLIVSSGEAIVGLAFRKASLTAL